jgi:hypothetical protein
MPFSAPLDMLDFISGHLVSDAEEDLISLLFQNLNEPP